MKPSKGLKESIGSVKEKYSWGTGKIATKCFISVAYNILWGWSLYGSDVATDLKFYLGLSVEKGEERIASLIHIIMPFAFSVFVFFNLLWSRILKFDHYLFFKFPLPPFTQLYKTIIEFKSFVNNKNKEDTNYEQKNIHLTQELEDQKIITTVSMILEASMESSFQFFFQGLFSLPTLVFAFMNIHEGTMKMTDLVNWTNVSIVLSFLSFAYTSYNIRYVLTSTLKILKSYSR